MANIFDKAYRSSRISLLRSALDHFSFAERIIFFILSALLFLSAFSMVLRLNDLLVVAVPVSGGSFTEGIIGSPRFINPLLAVSDADRDLTALVYSGLLRAAPEGGYLPDLAEHFSVSEDGLTYTFTLREGVVFHDGTPLTADDVLFTVQKAQDPLLKSPKRANWNSIDTEKVSDKEIRFHLKQPYAPFLENTTLGILPKHLWKDLSEEEFTFSISNSQKPIGSGPYRVASVEFDPEKGLPLGYTLRSFSDFALGKPYISQIQLRFYPNEELLIKAKTNNEIASFGGIDPKSAASLNLGLAPLTASLPRVFGIFFNQNEAPVLTRSEVREALAMTVDRNRIISEALFGFAVPISSPFPPGVLVPIQMASSTDEQMRAARELLERRGWVKNAEEVYEKTETKGSGKQKKEEKVALSFSLSTSNAPELKKTAEIVKENWKVLGAKVDVNYFELGDLTLNIIRPREYQSLLYGEVVGRDLDLYAFWHSSQRNDPGLNIALYANKKVDDTLGEARATTDRDVRIQKFNTFLDEIRKDIPAVFLYSPEFIYFPPTQVKGIYIKGLSISSERFSGIYAWYIETEKVWKWFVKELP